MRFQDSKQKVLSEDSMQERVPVKVPEGSEVPSFQAKVPNFKGSKVPMKGSK